MLEEQRWLYTVLQWQAANADLTRQESKMSLVQAVRPCCSTRTAPSLSAILVASQSTQAQLEQTLKS